jgi:hypothetical protein
LKGTFLPAYGFLTSRLGCNEDARGDVLPLVTLDVSESQLAHYEWIEEARKALP